ncbi:ras guanine nucleotide exchange factor domain-containing protein [Apiospora kogelbergensis]|uniref:ras guanine nucleotide exchange factor domain-containing protein n=1 Tax=Apiospora kogelbergensis TaxID=1337665 RepID=UPI00312F8E51
MESINIACIGANGVGKSHFIQRAIGLTKAPGPQPTAARVFIDNVPYAVTLFELDLEYFDVNPERQIQWPRQIGGTMMPPIDGVLLLYDVMNKESIMELPQTLTALVNSSLPTVLVATKCDNPENVRQVNTEALASACQSCVSDFKTSASKPENSRNALFRLVRVLVANRQDRPMGSFMTYMTYPSKGDVYWTFTDFKKAEASGTRRRAASVAHLDTPHDSTGTRPLSQHSKHSRASSDMSLVRGLPPQSAGDENQTVSSMLRTPGIRLDRHNTPSFLDIEESDGESFGYNDDIPILQRNDEMTFDRPAKRQGNFADVFLCLYRKFAAPGELFSAILTRLEQVKDDKSVHYLTKTSAQLRIIETVAKWVASYPGDFARPTTRRTLEDFIRRLSCEPIFAAAAQQMRRNLEFSVFEDDDTGWAKADVIEEDSASGASSLGRPEAPRGPELNESISSLSVEDHNPGRRPSATSSLNTNTDIGPTKVHQFQFHSYEDYEREAATMVPSYTMPLTKFRYHIFMDTSDDDIADEITRIDWVMFSSIRIRDLVRHVSLNAQQREKSRGMKNVNRMVSHFNHIAKWVANMILMRDKAKHRAQMLEKFMSIALKLRQLNNYNGLAAVLAGINGTAIHRLAQTKALVPAEVQKRFARLVLLMGTQKSHFAYRLAWENSPLPRIPFMPLHRRDLVSAEEGSMTFVGPEGDRINWKKFEVLGEVCLPIMKSQGTPYPNLTKHDVARELILDCLMPTDDEDIYQRSVTVESQGAGGYDASKKKFPWFAKQ